VSDKGPLQKAREKVKVLNWILAHPSKSKDLLAPGAKVGTLTGNSIKAIPHE